MQHTMMNKITLENTTNPNLQQQDTGLGTSLSNSNFMSTKNSMKNSNIISNEKSQFTTNTLTEHKSDVVSYSNISQTQTLSTTINGHTSSSTQQNTQQSISMSNDLNDFPSILSPGLPNFNDIPDFSNKSLESIMDSTTQQLSKLMSTNTQSTITSENITQATLEPINDTIPKQIQE